MDFVAKEMVGGIHCQRVSGVQKISHRRTEGRKFNHTAQTSSKPLLHNSYHKRSAKNTRHISSPAGIYQNRSLGYLFHLGFSLPSTMFRFDGFFKSYLSTEKHSIIRMQHRCSNQDQTSWMNINLNCATTQTDDKLQLLVNPKHRAVQQNLQIITKQSSRRGKIRRMACP
ncbi:hypothetical protein SUGI_0741780 [Cryptomeria japonica]|nr:hypothetical protein SUGI_0741780 [Cryptomeria japonica]